MYFTFTGYNLKRYKNARRCMKNCKMHKDAPNEWSVKEEQ